MQYREFGKKGFKSSLLGFGTMRLPLVSNGGQKIDEKETEKMILYAIEHGINYFDTAYLYHEGQSEAVLGSILKRNQCRDKVAIATKMPGWLTYFYEDFDRYLNEQLARLQTDHIDFYLLHSLFSIRWDRLHDLKVLDWAEKAQRDGRIGEFGFSFHDGFDVFKKIIDAYDKWAFCLIQYNYLNESVQAGRKGLDYAIDRDISVVVMEPLLGGLLANPPQGIRELFRQNSVDPVDFAFRWIWDQHGVASTLSGMSSLEMLKKNIALAENYQPGVVVDHEFLKRVQDEFMAYHKIPCTKCAYCMPCPHDVDIPRMFELYNQSLIKSAGDRHNRFQFIREHFFNMSKTHYNYHTPVSHRASSCVRCGACEEKCPQHIKISEHMPEIHISLSFIKHNPEETAI
jgi:uncharacterized protein